MARRPPVVTPEDPGRWLAAITGVQLDPRKRVIGQRIRYLRLVLNNGESRVALARAMSPQVTPGAIDQWESGRTSPSYANLTDIAAHYAVSTDYLLCVEFRKLSNKQLLRLPTSAIERSPYLANDQPVWLNKTSRS